ncbi:23S rRNA pseudouridine(955/2504/2580) synthase RluC [Zooshikella marina]|uniref:23S rRNA pseudouridine(955/2504/2580) synthase RluC n=1 Tax=Zooshikella ganghwensis TaxID=202772 RepID=UPI001BAF7B6A|nr:23S rRNA pseudouridine(955/2504/2580) synthase RluC [Zooshikella ganghwensis]MBU2705208.1 23S rRNA pseudouridine(955/2504/2580) synthase RluC [Zooshikella ganghwensis]
MSNDSTLHAVTAADFSQVQHLVVTEEYAGQRIDNMLKVLLKGVPLTHIYRLLRKGEIRVNKSRIKAHYRLAPGDQLRLPPIRVSDSKEKQPKARPLQLQQIEDAIIYEDSGLLAINKPTGFAVHGGSGIKLGVIEILRQLRPQCKVLELVHRLDRDTSGCLLIAKKKSVLRHLHQQLRDDQVHKVYHALVVGRWPARKKMINVPLQKNTLQSGERMVKADSAGKPSSTEFRVLTRYKSATLMEAKPITGRTHQIRVHSQYAGHPIIGDEKYGVEEVNSTMRGIGIKRLFLHAAAITFILPETGKPFTISAPLPDDLQKGLSCLQ